MRSESIEILRSQNCCKDGNYHTTRLISQEHYAPNAIGTLRRTVARNTVADAVSVAPRGRNLRLPPRAPRGILRLELEGSKLLGATVAHPTATVWSDACCSMNSVMILVSTASTVPSAAKTLRNIKIQFFGLRANRG